MIRSYFFFLILTSLFLLGCSPEKQRPAQVPDRQEAANAYAADAKKSVHDFSVQTIEGDTVSLNKYAGKKLLIVNVASECGFTSQYEDLQRVQEQMKDRLVVLGFPANNFGGQEPGTEAEIKQFCEARFGVTFPMFSKISVVGAEQHPLYTWLTDPARNGWNNQEPEWNFTKYLVDEDGQLLHYYPSRTNPTEIMNQINQDEIE